MVRAHSLQERDGVDFLGPQEAPSPANPKADRTWTRVTLTDCKMQSSTFSPGLSRRLLNRALSDAQQGTGLAPVKRERSKSETPPAARRSRRRDAAVGLAERIEAGGELS
jgi:hypothetical protein